VTLHYQYCLFIQLCSRCAVDNTCVSVDFLQADASRGCVVVAQMSSDGCLTNDEYAQRKSPTAVYSVEL